MRTIISHLLLRYQPFSPIWFGVVLPKSQGTLTTYPSSNSCKPTFLRLPTQDCHTVHAGLTEYGCRWHKHVLHAIHSFQIQPIRRILAAEWRLEQARAGLPRFGPASSCPWPSTLSFWQTNQQRCVRVNLNKDVFSFWEALSCMAHGRTRSCLLPSRVRVNGVFTLPRAWWVILVIWSLLRGAAHPGYRYVPRIWQRMRRLGKAWLWKSPHPELFTTAPHLCLPNDRLQEMVGGVPFTLDLL